MKFFSIPGYYLSFLIFIIFSTGNIYSQTVPYELMAGHKYTRIKVNIRKNFNENSRSGIYHQNKLEVYYADKSLNSFSMQSYLYYQPWNFIRIYGGFTYSNSGLKPATRIQLLTEYKNFTANLALRMSIQKNPVYAAIANIQYKAPLNDKLKTFAALRTDISIQNEGIIKASPWLKYGFEIRMTQFGLGFSVDDIGNGRRPDYNFGAFIIQNL